MIEQQKQEYGSSIIYTNVSVLFYMYLCYKIELKKIYLEYFIKDSKYVNQSRKEYK